MAAIECGLWLGARDRGARRHHWTGHANGTQRTYTLVGADSGRTMRVRVTATNADGSASAQSDQTAVVAPATSTAGPRNTAAPTITGTAKVGEELTANEGTWTANPTSFAYQWQRCDVDVAVCSNVTGATGKTYGVRVADLGYRLRVAVTARNARGSATANSAITAIVAPLVTITNKRPTIAIVSVRFTGATVYARFRICDDTAKNVTILATDSRPNRASFTRRRLCSLRSGRDRQCARAGVSDCIVRQRHRVHAHGVRRLPRGDQARRPAYPAETPSMRQASL